MIVQAFNYWKRCTIDEFVFGIPYTHKIFKDIFKRQNLHYQIRLQSLGGNNASLSFQWLEDSIRFYLYTQEERIISQLLSFGESIPDTEWAVQQQSTDTYTASPIGDH